MICVYVICECCGCVEGGLHYVYSMYVQDECCCMTCVSIYDVHVYIMCVMCVCAV